VPDPTDIASWDATHGLRPFSEALRDRLITHFEVKNLTHKPKLVAVTSCGGAVGVSTVAAGLAASLSETGEGNVLLVDMNIQNGAAHHFYKGDLARGIEDALETQTRDSALVQHKLYVVAESAGDNKLPSVLPKRFKNLVPRLKASDYDYIIFDMPAVSQISLTPRLARFMDMVLLVVESGKTSGEAVKQATALMAGSKENIGVVLNKGHNYIPRKLRQDL
jgi:Mrp family chromosome partitioning ATPase